MIRTFITATAISACLLLSACLHEPIHQGNRLDGDKIHQITEGNTKFAIEQILGSPILNSTLHPNRVTYYEEFDDEESGKLLWRSIEIEYDDALRAKKITRTGFEEK
ncbi:outer membrane protein assembly factor BamE [Mariprofundus sp. EBB-1]|uniref:outer membrane protein assembly factor BamE domain-containing protein n=1 Tax=Mariprofundus sp. EBB-1 TaxID=2650971 RepID=UPI000EF273E0|nr:outer membrane protein assembly factor BamE [Mariprofundus sp. EBB-1]RLL50724.1 outer membrane protein assembly factor BamE [Mariprofundus sp. EBB-1]